MGLGYYRFRLVGRYWSRRYAYLGRIAPVPSELAKFDQPLGRSHDYIRRYLCRDLYYITHGSSMDVLLGASITEPVRFIMGEL